MRNRGKIKRSVLGLVVFALTCVQGIAAAQPKSRVLYAHRAWEVRGVVFDRGTSICVAQIRLDDAAFSIWADGENPIRLQFYSPRWKFADVKRDLRVQIDDRDEWMLADSDLYENAAFFTLPADEGGIRFIDEVAAGLQLELRLEDGRQLKTYALSGSNASIRALGRCVDAIRYRPNDPDPFD